MSLTRTRWAAVGAAVAVALGAGGVGLVDATKGSGERSVYTAIEPCRLVDTRPNHGIGGRTAPLGPGEVYPLTAHGDNGECEGIPVDTVALELNVTGLQNTGATHFTIWSGAGPVPNASHVNLAPGASATPNSVTTELDGPSFAIRNNSATAHVVIDIVGIYQDHHHDDRYYTENEADTRFQRAPGHVAVHQLDFWLGSGWGRSGPSATDDGSLLRSSGASSCIAAPIRLPAGRTVERIGVRYRDFAVAQDVDVTLRRIDWSGSPVTSTVLVDSTTSFPTFPDEFGAVERDVAATSTATTVDDDAYTLSICTGGSIQIFDAVIDLG